MSLITAPDQSRSVSPTQPELVSQSLGPVTEVGGSAGQSYVAYAPVGQSQREGDLTLLDVSTQVIDGGETILDGGVSESIIGGGLETVEDEKVLVEAVGPSTGQDVVDIVQSQQEYAVPQVSAS